MQESKYIQLIHKKLTGDINPSEDAALSQWLEDSPDHLKVFSDLEQAWNISEQYEKSFTPNVDLALVNLKKRIQEDKDQTRLTIAKKPRPSRKLYWYGIAASIALLVSIGLWNVSNSNQTSDLISMEAKTSDQIQMLSLEDGSKVWLNKNSKLSYPEKFDTDQRVVRLEGEAFFDIAKETKRSFIIETAATKVKVLGTSFNVITDATKAQTSVLVKTGKVRFENHENNQSVELVANEKASYNHKSQQFVKLQAQSLNELAWQSKQLNFNNTPFTQLVEDLENYYQIKIDYTDTNLKNCRYTSLFNNSQLEDIWTALEATFELKIQRKNVKSFKIIGGSCK